MAMINMIVLSVFTVVQLTAGLHRAAPRLLDAATAERHVLAARAAATKVVPEELLLGMAYIESRYLPNATSRQVKGQKKRTTGLWDSDVEPPNTVAPWFCGVTQTMARTWERCLELRNIEEAYKVAVQELTNWYRSPPCRKHEDRMRCALLGYGGGWRAIELDVGTYPNRVLHQATRLRRITETAMTHDKRVL